MKKKIIFLLCLGAASAQQSCSDKCGVGITYYADFVNVSSAICENDVAVEAGASMASQDLRIKIFGEFVAARADTDLYDLPCSTVPGSVEGLNYRITELKVVCDRDVAGIPAGENLVEEINPVIAWSGLYRWRPAEWIENINKCRVDGVNGVEQYLRPGINYEFDLELLPYFITVEEGDYTFSLSIRFKWIHPNERSYSKTFPTVTLH